MALLLLASGTQLVAAASALDSGTICLALDSGLLKVAVTRNAIAVAKVALRQPGNHGLLRRNPLLRHHRDVLCGRLHTPQDDTVLLAAGRATLQPAA